MIVLRGEFILPLKIKKGQYPNKDGHYGVHCKKHKSGQRNGVLSLSANESGLIAWRTKVHKNSVFFF